MRVNGLRVLVLLEDQSKIVRGIQRLSSPPPASGVVLAYGEGLEDIELGERVAFHSFAGTTMSVKGKRCKLLDINDILLCFGRDDAAS